MLDVLTVVIGGAVFYFVIVRSFSLKFTQKFDCTRCGKCCKAKVVLSKKDIERLEKAGLKRVDFLDFTLGFIPRLQVANGQCKFLQKVADGTYFCRIYGARPGICRSFPKFFNFPLVDISCGFYRDKWF